MRLSKSKWCISASVYRHWIAKNTTHNIQVHTHKWKMTQFKVRDAKSITRKLLNLSHFENVMIIAPNYISKNMAVFAHVFDTHTCWFYNMQGCHQVLSIGCPAAFFWFASLAIHINECNQECNQGELAFYLFCVGICVFGVCDSAALFTEIPINGWQERHPFQSIWVRESSLLCHRKAP